jgi:hypothetical protein
MSKAIIGLTIAAFASACGPHVADAAHPPGELVYQDSFKRLYRLDRRVEVVYDYERDDGRDGRCGILTDRAYDELENALAELDPSVDYGEHPADCSTSGVLIHVDDFEHSPFECSFSCCQRDLYRAAFVYTMILIDFCFQPYIEIEGEPYVAIEPDQPCP